MISPGQRFMTMSLLETHLDAMEIARLNVLHFHLSEFCRYAVESKAFPALAANWVDKNKHAVLKNTCSHCFFNAKHSKQTQAANLSSGLNEGFYSWHDINTLVAQAKLRGIRVIPEYDVPGHQGRNVGLVQELQWCSKAPPAASGYQLGCYPQKINLKKQINTQINVFAECFSECL